MSVIDQSNTSEGHDIVGQTARQRECRIQSGNESQQDKKETVVLLGSGDMSMALAINLLRTNIHPIIASRNPERARIRLKKMRNLEVDVAPIGEGLAMGDLVVVAIPSEYHSSLPKEVLSNKILIDISNRSPSEPSGCMSNAEKLQDLFPESQVVKAFNTMSSYALSQGSIQGSREVPICSDSEGARNRVSSLVRAIGLIPMDYGVLKNARAVEDIPLSFFPEWRLAFVLSLCLFIFYFLLVLFRSQLCPNIEKQNKTEWDFQSFNEIPLDNVQMSLSFTAATLLLVTYIPGCLAAYIQLFRGTKYSQFPDWLDNWIKSRKQFGLLALLFGGLHGCLAIFTKMEWGVSHPAVWQEQLYCMSGPVLLATLAVLGITSLPSVSACLTWREFSIFQRYLGWSAVVLITLHDGFSNFKMLLNPTGCVVIPTGGQITVALCLLTVLLKIPLLIPCVNWYLMRIRNGYERSSFKSSPV